jgi:hypothetical protein
MGLHRPGHKQHARPISYCENPLGYEEKPLSALEANKFTSGVLILLAKLAIRKKARLRSTT